MATATTRQTLDEAMDEIELAAACQAEFETMYGHFFANETASHQRVWARAIENALAYWRGQFPGSRDVAYELKVEALRVVRERMAA